MTAREKAEKTVEALKKRKADKEKKASAEYTAYLCTTLTRVRRRCR